MTLQDYMIECRRLADVCRERCSELDRFLLSSPSLDDEAVFKAFWSFDSEVAKAHREYIEFSDSNRGKVSS